jgi:RNA recognition motif-containing protein
MQVITDPATARSKGFGFVRFGDEAERNQALQTMTGQMISGRAIRVSHATTKKPGDAQVISFSTKRHATHHLFMHLHLASSTGMLCFARASLSLQKC